MQFQYPEDRKFFVNFLAHGDESIFEHKFKQLFDFRDPDIKRKEFNSIRKQIYNKLLQKYGKVCQLKASSKCSFSDEFHVDHFIPLKSNELNKNIRKQKRTDSKKIPAQSFGSNHPDNFVLACKNCNRDKGYFFHKPQYRILMIEDDTLRKECKVKEFTLPKNESRIELIRWNKLPKNYLKEIEKLQPDLVALNSVLVPDEWMALTLQMKNAPSLKEIPIFLSSYLGALSSMELWLFSGITDFLTTTKPEEIIEQYLAYLRHPKRYKPQKGLSIFHPLQ